jgi:hypothetical protein
MSQGPVANVVTTAANAVWYTDRCEIVTGATPVTYQVYATALRDQSAQGNIYSNPSSVDANSADTIYVGVGNYLTITGANFTAQEIGGQTSAQAGVGGYGVDNIGPPPVPPTPAPTIATISPNVGVFTGNTVVTIAGNNFIDVTGVTFGGTSATGLSVANVTSITANTPSGTIGATVDVAVVANAGTATSTAAFTYTAPAPTIASVAPVIGPNTGLTAISITGTNYISVTGVTVGGNAASNVNTVSANLITARTPEGAVGNVNIVVAAAGGNVTAVNGFQYLPTTEPETNAGSSFVPTFPITPGAPYPSTGDVTVGWTINFGSNSMPTGQYVIVVRGFPDNPSPTTQLQIQTSGGFLSVGTSYTFTAPVTPPFPVTPYYRLQPGSQGGPGNVNIYLDLAESNNTYPTMSNIAAGWSIYGASRGLSALGTVTSAQTTGSNVRVGCNFAVSTAADFSMRFAPP